MVGAVASLSAFYHETMDVTTPEGRLDVVYKIIGKMPTLAAMHKYSIGEPINYPHKERGYGATFTYAFIHQIIHMKLRQQLPKQWK